MSDLPDCAAVYFHDGMTLGPMIALATRGDELPQLIVESFMDLSRQGNDQPTFGQVGAMLVYKAVAAGHIVSLQPPPPRGGLGNQLASLFTREASLGGIGVVLIDMIEKTCTTYGGRGFPEIAPGPPFTPVTFPLGLLEEARRADLSFVNAPATKELEPPLQKKKTARKKTAKKKAGKKKAAGKTDVVQVG